MRAAFCARVLILFADNDTPTLARSFAGDAIDFDAIDEANLPQEIEIRVRDLAIFASGGKQVSERTRRRHEPRVVCVCSFSVCE